MENSNQKSTSSIQNGKKIIQTHNTHERPEKNIDPNGPHETIVHEKPTKVMRELLYEVAMKYNEHQKRKDRKIDLDKYVEDKKDGLREIIVMVGRYGNKPEKAVVYNILKEYLDGWCERNPNFPLVGAYYHGDEKAGDHLHIDYFGLGHNYSRGMSVQISLGRALEEMGFVTGYDEDGEYKLAITKWQDRERKVLDQICAGHGLEIHHPEIEFKEHMKIQKFRAVMELKNLYQEIGQAKELVDKLRGNIEELKLTAAIENDNIEEIQESVKERMQDVGHTVTLTNREYNDLLKSALKYESVLDTYADRGERMIEMHETLREYKHSLEKMEKSLERMEEYEEVLSNIQDEHGMTALEAFEKQKKKEEKEKKKGKQNSEDKDDVAVR